MADVEFTLQRVIKLQQDLKKEVKESKTAYTELIKETIDYVKALERLNVVRGARSGNGANVSPFAPATTPTQPNVPSTNTNQHPNNTQPINAKTVQGRAFDIHSLMRTQLSGSQGLDFNSIRNSLGGMGNTLGIRTGGNILGDVSSSMGRIMQGVNQLQRGVQATGTAARTATTATSALGGAATSAGGSMAGMASGAIAAAGATMAVVAGVVALLGVMVKLGGDSYKTNLSIEGSIRKIGGNYETAVAQAKELNRELGIAEEKSLRLLANSTIDIKGAGASSGISADIAGKLMDKAKNISAATGTPIEEVMKNLTSAVSTGSDAALQYGARVDDLTLKGFLWSQGIDAVNNQLSDESMVLARTILALQGTAGYTDKVGVNSDSLAVRLSQLKESMSTLGQTVQAVFLPVFEWVVNGLADFSTGVLQAVNAIREFFGMKRIDVSTQDDIIKEQDKIAKLQDEYRKTGEQITKFKESYSFDELNTDSTFLDASDSLSNMLKDLTGGGDEVNGKGKMSKTIDIKANVTPAMKALDQFLTKVPGGKFISAFLNLKGKEWEKMSDTEKMLSNPAKWFVELVAKGDATTWDFVKAVALEGVHNLPLVAGISALLKGDWPKALKELVVKGGINPLMLPIHLLFSGLETFFNFKKEYEAINQRAFNPVMDAFSAKREAAYPGTQNAKYQTGFYTTTLTDSEYKTAKGKELAADLKKSISEKIGFVGVNTQGLNTKGLKKHAMGGMHIGESLGIVGDVPEMTLPLAGAGADVGFKKLGSAVSEQLGGGSVGAAPEITVHLGQSGIIIASDMQLRQLANTLTDYIALNLRDKGYIGQGTR